MEQENCTYNQLLDRLKHTHPVLDNPEELTGNILMRIGHLQEVRRKNRVWAATGWFSGIAAACFFGFSVCETLQPSVSTAFVERSQVETFVRYTPPEQMAASPEPDMSTKKERFHCILKEKQKIRSIKHRLFANYMSYLYNE